MITRKMFHLSTAVVGMLLLFFSVPLTAQDNSLKPTVNHAVTSGISAPLRDLAKLPRAPQYGFHEANPVDRIPMRPGASVVDRVEQNTAGSSANYSVGINVLGLGNGFPNFTMRVAPPDTDMAVGDTQLIEYVNLSWEVFDKSGNPLIGPFDGNSLWASGIPGTLCALQDSGDPIVKWDRVVHRWLLFQNVFVSPYAICIAISTSADATGTYYVYQFSIPGNGFPDYQKIGIWPTGYFQANNNFGVNKSGYVGSQICAYNRVKLLTGDASAEQQCVQLNENDYSLLPEMWIRQPLRPQARMSSLSAAWDVWTPLICPCTPTMLISRLRRIRSLPATIIPNCYPLPALPLPVIPSCKPGAAIAFPRKAFPTSSTHWAIA